MMFKFYLGWCREASFTVGKFRPVYLPESHSGVIMGMDRSGSTF